MPKFWNLQDHIFTYSVIVLFVFIRGQDKTADFKWDKTADFENETKSPILKWDKTADFVKEQIAIKIVSLITTSWPNYR